MQMTSIEYLVEGWLEKKSNYLLSLSILSPTTKLVYNYRFLTCLLWLNNCGNN